ncbi:Beta-amylase 7 [Camellia lanceoleosa]|uniref:Beta-amylase 7 n=1 Tax=Camellia lanceoleosa TaxID=1840588 RepID=A0ACC0FZI5_9ERIC|nr:Beta-amylase 7 [Camellia lanceoleosa]
MSFRECGGNVGDDVHIPLPQLLAEIGQRNPDIFFTYKQGRHNPECLTWGIDKERVLRGRAAVEVKQSWICNLCPKENGTKFGLQQRKKKRYLLVCTVNIVTCFSSGVKDKNVLFHEYDCMVQIDFCYGEILIARNELLSMTTL